jgi:hypothetical protein
MSPGKDQVLCPVKIIAGSKYRECVARIDADCWPVSSVPVELSGVLEISRAEWKELAAEERLILTLQSTGEPYRMILDPGTGRFLARRL